MSSSIAATESLNAGKLFDLSGWTALVTGGGTGIGLMCAQTLVANGAKVYITGRRMEALQQAADAHGKGKMIPLQMDVTKKESVTSVFEELAKKEDKLHLLINNAGIAGPTRATPEKAAQSATALSEEMLKDSYQDWLDVYATNVVAPAFVTAAALPLLNKASLTTPGFSASVIVISSISGMIASTQHHIPYNASKGAAIHLTTLLGRELSAPGTKVRVNGIAPGIFPSEMTASESGGDQKSHIDADGYREQKGIPAGRPGKEDDMAIAVLCAATNQYMNGETIRVDGGYTLQNA